MSMNQHTVSGNEGDQYVTTLNQGAYAVGTKMVLPEGREYRYVRNGASTGAAGKVVQGSAPVAAHVNLAVAAAAVGATTVDITFGTTAITADQYKDGFLVVEDGTGAGQMYKILSHPAANLSTALVVTLYPEAGLQVALDATSKVSLLKREWDGAILAPTTLTNVVIGVPLVTITAAYYGWAQKKGVCPALQDGAWTVGAGLMASNGTAGSLEDASLSVATTPVAGAQVTGPIVGAAVRNVGTTKYGIARLAL